MRTGKERPAIIRIFVFGCLILCGYSCATIGVADKATMMRKWQNKPHTVGLLQDINMWCNWYKGEIEATSVGYGNEGGSTWEYKKGTCVHQGDLKAEILTSLGIPFKRYTCSIKRGFFPIGHAFLIAQVGDQWYIMDNGAVQDVVWEWEAALKSTYGVSHVSEVKEFIHLD